MKFAFIASKEVALAVSARTGGIVSLPTGTGIFKRNSKRRPKISSELAEHVNKGEAQAALGASVRPKCKEPHVASEFRSY